VEEAAPQRPPKTEDESAAHDDEHYAGTPETSQARVHEVGRLTTARTRATGSSVAEPNQKSPSPRHNRTSSIWHYVREREARLPWTHDPIMYLTASSPPHPRVRSDLTHKRSRKMRVRSGVAPNCGQVPRRRTVRVWGVPHTDTGAHPTAVAIKSRIWGRRRSACWANNPSDGSAM